MPDLQHTRPLAAGEAEPRGLLAVFCDLLANGAPASRVAEIREAFTARLADLVSAGEEIPGDLLSSVPPGMRAAFLAGGLEACAAGLGGNTLARLVSDLDYELNNPECPDAMLLRLAEELEDYLTALPEALVTREWAAAVTPYFLQFALLSAAHVIRLGLSRPEKEKPEPARVWSAFPAAVPAGGH